MQDGDLVQKPESSAEESVTDGRDSESRTDGRSDTPVPRYRIHMRRNRGEIALYPRSTSPDSVNTEHQTPVRLKRTRRLSARQTGSFHRHLSLNSVWILRMLSCCKQWLVDAGTKQRYSENVYSFSFTIELP